MEVVPKSFLLLVLKVIPGGPTSDFLSCDTCHYFVTFE